MRLLTEKVGKNLWLVVMHHGHTDGVEAHQAEHRPVEGLRLHYLPDEESHPSLIFTVIGPVLTALYAGASKSYGARRATQRGRRWESHTVNKLTATIWVMQPVIRLQS